MDNAIQSSDQAGRAAGASRSSDEIDWTGQVLGDFHLMHRLGRGGMGQVYLAEQTSLKRKVALKLLHPELASNERSLSRFKAEAENVARATHANIVQIYVINQDKGIHYLALEYVEGKNLREFIEKKGTPELALGLHVMMQVAAALQRASELGIIHRDIKPENILLTKKGEVKVADFGLSRCFAEEANQSVTQSQVTMGTPLYMSPEQVERKTVDTRTDIYSFGVTCYHMFTGAPPYRGNSPIEVAYQHVHGEPTPLAQVRPDLPPALCAIIAKMMAKKPEDRYQSAREIGRDLNQLREALNLGAVAAISMSSSFIGAGSDGLRVGGSQPVMDAPPRASWLLPAAIGATLTLALAAGLTTGWYQYSRNLSIKDEQPPVVVPTPKPDMERRLPVTKEEEKDLQRLVQKYLMPSNHSEMVTGLQHARELGLYYLNERRLDEADVLFLELRKQDRKAVPAYHYFGRLGHATVLAFKDDYRASNQEFVKVLGDFEKIEARIGPGPLPKKKELILKDEVEAYRILWKEASASTLREKESSAPALREIVAKALDHNYANGPDEFPTEKLGAYRLPPRPTMKLP